MSRRLVVAALQNIAQPDLAALPPISADPCAPTPSQRSRKDVSSVKSPCRERIVAHSMTYALPSPEKEWIVCF